MPDAPAPPPSPAPAHRTPSCPSWVWGALLVVGTFLAYFPALNGGFIWNDSDYVTHPSLRSWAGLAKIWFQVGATEQYYPLLHSAFWVEQWLWGDAPLGYHLVNVALHAANALLLVGLLRRLAVPGAWLTGFLFALHPVCVESVAWIAEQKNTLSTFFALLAALAYLRFDARRRPADYAVASALFLAALLSKSLTATLTGALLVIAWWQRGRIEWRRDVVPLLPWIFLGAAAGLFTGWVERKLLYAEGPDFDLSLVQRALLAARVSWFYLGKLLWPAELIFIYPRWTVDPGVGWQWLFPATLLAMVGALWLMRRRTRGPLAVLLLFLGTLFPVSGFFNVYGFLFSYVADHWQYVPSIAALTLVGAGLARAAKRFAPAHGSVRVLLAGAVVTTLGALSFRQSGLYRDIVTFYERTLAANPNCWMAHNNLGILRAGERDFTAAIAHYRAGLQVKPDRHELHTNLGLAFAAASRWEEAAQHLGQAVKLNPNSHVAWDGLGSVLRHFGRLPEAVAMHERAIQLKPGFADAYSNLCAAWLDQNENEKALAAITTALRLNPGLPEAHNHFGIVLSRLGRTPEAVAHYREALRLRPGFAAAHDNLGAAYATAGDLDAAVREYEAALRLHGDSATTLNNLGNALRGLKRLDDAIAVLLRAVQAAPAHPVIQLNLALALNDAGRMDEARPYYQFARERLPGAPVIPALEATR